MDDRDNGYMASLDTTHSPASQEFWDGGKVIADPTGKQIEYVVHRMCSRALPYDLLGNACVQTADNTAALGNAVAIGNSLSVSAPAYAETPQVHYVITSRITGPRGGRVVNQLIVLIGA